MGLGGAGDHSPPGGAPRASPSPSRGQPQTSGLPPAGGGGGGGPGLAEPGARRPGHRGVTASPALGTAPSPAGTEPREAASHPDF